MSVDTRGVIEYWDQTSGQAPSPPDTLDLSAVTKKLKEDGLAVSFRFKTDSDLYDLAKV